MDKTIEFKMLSEMRRVMCYKCFTIVFTKVFFMAHKSAVTHFIFPTKEKPFICDECKKKKENKNG